ncbi:hypothetical protein [Ralstonia pseudosolanacearum]|uniref:Transmembrane protein n=1 Tax=Ralstonia solanacearum TaxID=305 RepID=A0AA92K2I6_RALSL|nr:hypothetical protein [Ralstonia pseudosolanacearum]QOK97444.1 hypothetical protein HF909_14075 [Ralstonia pseudosolanacearum]UWD90213.1 hypothetical protein NY025_21520 [Ralstonia pseudosolanacearum]
MMSSYPYDTFASTEFASHMSRPPSTRPLNQNGAKMGIQCPKCSSDNVQSIRAVLQSGTTYSTGSIVGVGVGTDGAGTFGGSTASTSQTSLAARFSPPKKPKKLEIISGAVMSLATSPWLFSKTPLMAITIGIILWWVWEILAYKKRDKKYKEEYPIWKNMHDHGYYCHRCSYTFLVK